VSPLRLLIPLAAVVVALAACGKEEGERAAGPPEPVLTPDSVRKGAAVERGQRRKERERARVVELETPGADQGGGDSGRRDAPSPGAPTDAEVKAELKQARAELKDFRSHLATTAFLQTGPRARVLSDGTAQAPDDAPDIVKRIILGANEIAKFPYKWGGGHGAWRDDGYDCSGSVSFALAGAGLLRRPLASGGFVGYGEEGPGEWVTIYTNPGHIFMVVAGLRFDTSGRGRAGTRWQDAARSTQGYVVRHPPGL
jgi:hypothetical protein